MTDSRQRDKRGRFVRGNTIASAGGYARAAKLSPRRRRAIARLARRRMVERHFGGDDGQQRRYLAELGRYAYEAQAYVAMRTPTHQGNASTEQQAT